MGVWETLAAISRDDKTANRNNFLSLTTFVWSGSVFTYGFDPNTAEIILTGVFSVKVKRPNSEGRSVSGA
jgi:hypothetical protein